MGGCIRGQSWGVLLRPVGACGWGLAVEACAWLLLLTLLLLVVAVVALLLLWCCSQGGAPSCWAFAVPKKSSSSCMIRYVSTGNPRLTATLWRLHLVEGLYVAGLVAAAEGALCGRT
jgi:hypothetical protein